MPLESNTDFLEAKADFVYGYGDALRDERVVRRVIFPSWEGELEWYADGQLFKASFGDELNDVQSGNRLKTAIYHEGQWIKDVIKAADKKLTEIRGLGFEDAGGLILAKDQEAAKSLANVLEELTGEKPTIAISNMPDDMGEASSEISSFRNSKKKWIVAVKMVSEGVDIKRLQVMVYATNTLTRTFFRQAVGRVIRWDNKWNNLDVDQTAWCFAPQDPKLVQHMKEIEKEITDIIRLSIETNEAVPSDGQFPINFWEFIDADNAAEAIHVFSSEEFTSAELLAAEAIFSDMPGFERLPSAYKAYAIRSGLLYKRLAEMHQEGVVPNVQPVPSTEASDFVVPQPKKSKKDQSNQLRSKLKSSVGALIYACRQNGIGIPGENPYQTVNMAWIRKRGKSTKESTIDELHAKIEWVNNLTKRALNADHSITSELQVRRSYG